MYLNGVLKDSQPLGLTGNVNVNPPGTWSIGAYSTLYYGGLIDDVRIYNRALSAAEVQALYAATNK